MSTIDAITELYGKTIKSIDAGENVLAVFLDLSQAFDTLPHDKIIYKLHHYGIRGLALNWFKSYLLDRKMYVFCDGCKSSETNVNCGVPQGSVLGPLLFLLYVKIYTMQ